MKVLHVNEHLAYKGGVETYLFGLFPRLKAAGITPVVAYAAPGDVPRAGDRHGRLSGGSAVSRADGTDPASGAAGCGARAQRAKRGRPTGRV